MKRYITLLCAGVAFAIAPVNAAVTLTNFGTSTSRAFTVDTGTTTFSRTQTATQISISGSDQGSILAGTFAPINITGLSGSLILQGSTTAAPSSSFSLTLYDSNFRTALYSGGSWTALSSGSSVLSFNTADGSFDFADVIGVQLDTAGSPPGTSIGAVLTGLGVVPEPTRALLLGVGLMGLMMRRRR